MEGSVIVIATVGVPSSRLKIHIYIENMLLIPGHCFEIFIAECLHEVVRIVFTLTGHESLGAVHVWAPAVGIADYDTNCEYDYGALVTGRSCTRSFN